MRCSPNSEQAQDPQSEWLSQPYTCSPGRSGQPVTVHDHFPRVQSPAGGLDSVLNTLAGKLAGGRMGLSWVMLAMERALVTAATAATVATAVLETMMEVAVAIQMSAGTVRERGSMEAGECWKAQAEAVLARRALQTVAPSWVGLILLRACHSRS